MLRHPGINPKDKFQAFFFGLHADNIGNITENLFEVERNRLQLQFSGVDLGKIVTA
jgi:hypothetical protein